MKCLLMEEDMATYLLLARSPPPPSHWLATNSTSKSMYFQGQWYSALCPFHIRAGDSASVFFGMLQSGDDSLLNYAQKKYCDAEHSEDKKKTNISNT